MSSKLNILLLPGDGIGPEIIAAAQVALQLVANHHGNINFEPGLIGGAAVDSLGEPLPQVTLDAAQNSSAILLGAVGGPAYETLPKHLRPEQGLLQIRKKLDLFANLRPARVFNELLDASPLKSELIAGLDILIVRELTSGIYFGNPRGIFTDDNNQRYGVNTYYYHENEISRILHQAFTIAKARSGKLCSVDKANVLETTELWRQIATEMQKSQFPDVELRHLYVDNASMQLCINPRQFDVIVTGNLFGDILSDEAAMLTGSIGMLPSASLNAKGFGMYEPIHGSAPDIAGQDIANPLGTILSLAMLLRHSLDQEVYANCIELAVEQVLSLGLRTADIYRNSQDQVQVGTKQMGAEVAQQLEQLLSKI